MKRSVMNILLLSLVFVARVHADEQHAAFIKNLFIAEAEKILQQENDALDTEMNRAPRPDAPAISHPIYPVGPLPGPQGPQGKPGPAASIPTCSPFKLLENATAGDVVRLVPDPTNQFGAKAAMRKIKKGPVFDWATRAGGTSSDAGSSVTTDCLGNIYVAGSFQGTVAFGNSITLVSAGSDDMFVAKLNSVTREWIWATRAGSDSTDVGDAINSITTDCQGNVYVTGQLSMTVTFGSITLSSTDPGETQIFAAKLNSATGAWIWATQATLGGDLTSNASNDITVDCLGNVYVTGSFQNTAVFGSTSLVSAGSNDIFVAKLNATTGAWVWATRAGSTGNDIARGVITDCLGSVYVTGLFQSTAAFGSTTLVSAGSFDIFVAKLNATTGAWIWATRAGSSAGSDAGNDIAVDCQGNIYITGDFIGTVTFGNTITLVSNTASQDMFVAKLNPTTGEWVWATRAGGSSGNDIGFDIATDFQGNVYATGSFQGTVTFGNNITFVSQETAPASGIFTIDIFVAKLNPTTGEWLWAIRAGGTGTDQGNGIATDCHGNIYVTGQFAGTVTFGNNITLVSAGSNDIFAAKIIDDERSLKTIGTLLETGAQGMLKPATFSGLLVPNVFTSLIPAADYYVDSTLTLTPCCCRCSKCCDANFKFMGTACSPTDFILQDCC